MADGLIQVTNVEQLTSWLGGNGWFEDALVLGLDPLPRPGGADSPPRVSLEFGRQIAGGFDAGGLRTLRILRVEAAGVRRWSLDPASSFEPGFCLMGVELPEPEGSVGLVFESPGRLTLVCSGLVVTTLVDRTEVIKPWASDRSFSAVVPSGTCPTPAEWSGWFFREGLDVAWRRYGEDAEPTERVPKDDYTGWFLQSPGRVTSTIGGLFIHECGANGDGELVLRMDRYDVDSRDLWECAGRIVGSFPGVLVCSGNCRLTGAQWLEFLGEGGPAYLDRLFPGTGGPSLPAD